MLLTEFRDILLTADPECKHYFGPGTGNYTVWHETGKTGLYGDNLEQEPVNRIMVDRFTKITYDPVVETIRKALERDDIASDYTVSVETDTGYIHHNWDCEAV